MKKRELKQQILDQSRTISGLNHKVNAMRDDQRRMRERAEHAEELAGVFARELERLWNDQLLDRYATFETFADLRNHLLRSDPVTMRKYLERDLPTAAFVPPDQRPKYEPTPQQVAEHAAAHAAFMQSVMQNKETK